MMATAAMAAAEQIFLQPQQLSTEALERLGYGDLGNTEGMILFNGLHPKVVGRVGECHGEVSGAHEGYDHAASQGLGGDQGSSPEISVAGHGDSCLSSENGDLKAFPYDDHGVIEGYQQQEVESPSTTSFQAPPQVAREVLSDGLCVSQVGQPPPIQLPHGHFVAVVSIQGVTQPPPPQELVGAGCLPLWRRTLDSDTEELLENQPVTWQTETHKWPSARNIKCELWFLPSLTAQCFQWADDIKHFQGLGHDLKPSRTGPFWAMHSSFLTHTLVDDGREVPNNRYDRDLKACHRNLLSMLQSSLPADRTTRCDFAELFSPPRIVPLAQESGLKVRRDHIFDLDADWDVRKKSCRNSFREFQRRHRPRMLMESPECKAFSQLMNVNWQRMNPSEVRRIRSEGELMWDFSVEAAEEQYAVGDYFALEHPAYASSWSKPRIQKLLRKPGVALIEFDMCHYGLTVTEGGELSKKSTRIATNNPWLAIALCQAQCAQDHSHVALQSGLPGRARIYTAAFCAEVVTATRQAVMEAPFPSLLHFNVGHENHPKCYVEFPEEEEEESRGVGDDLVKEVEVPIRQITEAQKRLVHKVHINTGHPPMSQFLRMLRAAGVHEHVLKFVRQEYSCEQCSVKVRKDNRRRAHCPRSFSFNKVLSIDVFYIHFLDLKVPILNMVCAGTNYHVTQRLPIPEGLTGSAPTSKTTWSHFQQTWLRFFGAPTMIITDSGSEFKGLFERGCESFGIMQHVCIPECPWENSKSERHGGWLKQKLDKEINSGQCSFASLSELDEFLNALTTTKNRWFHRGGFSPATLVFGEVPRVPGELLSDDHTALAGIADQFEDPLEAGSAAGEFRRRFHIREQARQLAMEQSSKEAISRAVKAAPHQARTWAPGQWVYVFRRGRQSQELHPRDRWCGPGVVVLANNRIVYVAMRTRLWRCSPEQLRAALPAEILGREIASDPGLSELLRQVISGTTAGAVDVVKEGSPPSDNAQFHPVDRQEIGCGEIEQRLPSDIPHLQSVAPIASGILPSSHFEPPLDEIQQVTPPPGLEPIRSNNNTRRRSMTSQLTEEEPAVEPSEGARSNPSTPLLSPVAEEHDESTEVSEPATKMPRLTDVISTTPQVGSDQLSSSAGMPPEQQEEDTRAPGTPLGRLFRRERIIGPMLPGPRPPTPAEFLPLDGRVRHLTQEFGDRERSPRRSTESPQEAADSSNNLLSTKMSFYTFKNGTWCLLAKRGDEISLKDLSKEEKAMFDSADQLEWDAILQTKAVRVIEGAEAGQARSQSPHRIISSRMVRRKKPQPGLHQWKAKSRWCLHGHTDPDTGTLVTYAPIPQGEGMMAFLQVSACLGFRNSFGDIKNAFCQSKPLHRERGPLYAEPCEGLNLPKGSLIVIQVPVYGLDDAPASWRLTVTEFLTQDCGFVRNLVEPCWFSKLDPKSGKPIAQILVEVDDFIIAAHPSYHAKLKQVLTQRFHFGKWEDDRAEYAGRSISCQEDKIEVDQSKYILEQIHPIILPKGRRQHSSDNLSPSEFEAFRSLIYRINWVGKETRPEVSGTASLMASKLKQAKIKDILTVNKVVNYLRSTATRPLTIWSFDPHNMCFIVCSDAGGINTNGYELLDSDNLPTDATQGGWIVLAAEKLPVGKSSIRASPISWRSSKLKRKVFSTFGGETQAMLQGVNEVDWLQIMCRDALFHDVQLKSWRNSLSPHMILMRDLAVIPNRQSQCVVTDAKSLYDCLLRENPSGKQDRKSALELAIILKDLQDTKSMIRWLPHQKMIADCLTKESLDRSNGALVQFLKSGWLSLVNVEEELEHRRTDPSYRKRSLKGSTEAPKGV